jgi:hypothetical protein
VCLCISKIEFEFELVQDILLAARGLPFQVELYGSGAAAACLGYKATWPSLPGAQRPAHPERNAPLRHFLLLGLVCATFTFAGCKDPTDGDPSPGSNAGSSGAAASVGAGGSGAGGSASGACPLTLTDGTTYSAVSCDANGFESFAAGIYQIQIAARFNTNQPIRSVNFTLNDDDLPEETHVKTFPVGTEKPGVNASYAVTFMDKWGTLDRTAVVGSGSFTVTEYDRANKLISGSYDIVVKQGTESKTITGELTQVPMERAD